MPKNRPYPNEGTEEFHERAMKKGPMRKRANAMAKAKAAKGKNPFTRMPHSMAGK